MADERMKNSRDRKEEEPDSVETPVPTVFQTDPAGYGDTFRSTMIHALLLFRTLSHSGSNIPTARAP